jgi:hydrogenase-1 operon protein HyaE
MNLVERLTHDLGYPLLADHAALAAFAEQDDNSVILLPANPLHYPETLDVAIVLPEMMRVFSGRMQAAVADATFARELAGKYSITEWPALLFLRQGAYLGSIARMRDWGVYLSKINTLLDAPVPVKAPGIGIPVVGVMS